MCNAHRSGYIEAFTALSRWESWTLWGGDDVAKMDNGYGESKKVGVRRLTPTYCAE
jgi:hypothetical protein